MLQFLKRTLLGILAAALPLGSFAAPSVVASQVIAGAASATGETPSFTVSGSNRVLYVGVILSDGPPAGVSNCKWGGSGGTAMTQIYDSGVVESFLELVWFRLIAPAASTTTVHCTFGATTSEYGVIAIATQDTDQTTPNGTIAGAHSNGYTPDPTVSVTSATGGLVIDTIGRFSNGNMTVGAGQTLLQHGQVSNVLNVSSSSEAGAASVAMGWSGNAAGTVSNYQWVTAGVPLNAPGASLPATGIILQLSK